MQKQQTLSRSMPRREGEAPRPTPDHPEALDAAAAFALGHWGSLRQLTRPGRELRRA
ncbi:hypothetical protein [Azospirillum sp. sgz302134]